MQFNTLAKLPKLSDLGTLSFFLFYSFWLCLFNFKCQLNLKTNSQDNNNTILYCMLLFQLSSVHYHGIDSSNCLTEDKLNRQLNNELLIISLLLLEGLSRKPWHHAFFLKNQHIH